MSQPISIGKINRTRIQTTEELSALIPILIGISKRSKEKCDFLNCVLKELQPQSEDAKEVSLNIEKEVDIWLEKIKRLGGIPTGTFSARFQTEDMTFSWRYPQQKMTTYNY